MVHRLASLQDFESIYDLYMEESANPYLTYDPMSKGDFQKIYTGLLKSETLFVAEHDATVISTYRLISKADRQVHTVYLGSFTIQKDFQGKGFGKKILEDVKAYAANQGKVRIELTVDINNTGAIALYKKVGFETEGRIRKSYTLAATNEFYDEYLMAVLL